MERGSRRRSLTTRSLPHFALPVLVACGGNQEMGSSPPGDSWASLAPMNEARQEVGVAELAGKIYVAGGFNASASTVATVEAYDVATNTWSFVAPMPEALNHCALIRVGDRLLVIGGFTHPFVPSGSTFEYDPRANTWQLKASMPTPRGAPMAAVLGGRVLVAGGLLAGSAVEAYDPAADTWETLPSLPTARNHLAGGVVGNRFFAVGGRPPLTLSVTEAFDASTRVWSTRAPMPTGRSGHAGAVVRGCLYAFGGEGNAASSTGVFPQNEVYDPRSDTWQSRVAMPTPRHGIGAAVVGDRIYIPGGATVQGFGVTAVHEVYTVPRDKTCQ